MTTTTQTSTPPPRATLAPGYGPPSPGAHSASIETLDGRPLSDGRLEFSLGIDVLTASFAATSRPGAFVSLYFGEGVRHIALRVASGRRWRARVLGTTFSAGGGRVLYLGEIEAIAEGPPRSRVA